VPLRICAMISCHNFSCEVHGHFCLFHLASESPKLIAAMSPERLSWFEKDGGFGRVPMWAKFGVARGPVEGPCLKRARGRPRKWLTARARWLAWSWRRKSWVVRSVGRPRNPRWIGVSPRERNTILVREWRKRRHGESRQGEMPVRPSFTEFCLTAARRERQRR
jgi:hypothetical protein